MNDMTELHTTLDAIFAGDTSEPVGYDVNHNPIHVGDAVSLDHPMVDEDHRGTTCTVIATHPKVAFGNLMRRGAKQVCLDNDTVGPDAVLRVISGPHASDEIQMPVGEWEDGAVVGHDSNGDEIRIGDRVEMTGEHVKEEYRGDVNIVLAPSFRSLSVSRVEGVNYLALDDGMVAPAELVTRVATTDA